MKGGAEETETLFLIGSCQARPLTFVMNAGATFIACTAAHVDDTRQNRKAMIRTSVVMIMMMVVMMMMMTTVVTVTRMSGAGCRVDGAGCTEQGAGFRMRMRT